jgi:hypothetical protein
MCELLVITILICTAVLLYPPAAQLVGLTVLAIVGVFLVSMALAEDRRPIPVPQLGAGCPTGYSASPTSGTCVPSAGTRCRAFPSPSGSCPTGWSYSPTARMCVEVGC